MNDKTQQYHKDEVRYMKSGHTNKKLDIPVGYGITAIETKKTGQDKCEDCYFNEVKCSKFPCMSISREDKKEVIYIMIYSSL